MELNTKKLRNPHINHDISNENLDIVPLDGEEGLNEKQDVNENKLEENGEEKKKKSNFYEEKTEEYSLEETIENPSQMSQHVTTMKYPHIFPTLRTTLPRVPWKILPYAGSMFIFVECLNE